jgi:hypothetical protein
LKTRAVPSPLQLPPAACDSGNSLVSLSNFPP